MSILHMGLIMLSVGATIYVAVTLLNILESSEGNKLDLYKKYAKTYVFYAEKEDRIVMRKCLPTECVKLLKDTPHLVLLGEL